MIDGIDSFLQSGGFETDSDRPRRSPLHDRRPARFRHDENHQRWPVVQQRPDVDDRWRQRQRLRRRDRQQSWPPSIPPPPAPAAKEPSMSTAPPRKWTVGGNLQVGGFHDKRIGIGPTALEDLEGNEVQYYRRHWSRHAQRQQRRAGEHRHAAAGRDRNQRSQPARLAGRPFRPRRARRRTHRAVGRFQRHESAESDPAAHSRPLDQRRRGQRHRQHLRAAVPQSRARRSPRRCRPDSCSSMPPEFTPSRQYPCSRRAGIPALELRCD